MTDADVDGSHIRTLLLHLLLSADAGRNRERLLFIAQPALFGVRKGKKYQYLKISSALDRFLMENGNRNLTVQASHGPRCPACRFSTWLLACVRCATSWPRSIAVATRASWLRCYAPKP